MNQFAHMQFLTLCNEQARGHYPRPTQTKKRTQASPGIVRSRWVWVKETQNTARYGLSAQLHSPSRKPFWRPMSQLLATFHCCNQFPWPKAIKSLFLLTVPEGQTSIMAEKARQWEQEAERSHLRKQSSNWKWGQATNTKSPPPESKPPPPKGSTTSTINSANVGVTPRVEVHKHGRHSSVESLELISMYLYFMCCWENLNFSFILCMDVLPVCIYVHYMHTWSSWTGVTDGYEPP